MAKERGGGVCFRPLTARLFRRRESSALLGIFLSVTPLYINLVGSMNMRSIAALSGEAVQFNRREAKIYAAE
jgi:hypothetical protein